MNFQCFIICDSSKIGDRQEDGSQPIGQLISIYHRFASHICTFLDYARNNSILEILKDVLCLSRTSLPSINAAYIFLVLKIHWSKVLYYAGWCALLLTFFLFFRNIKIAKIKFSSHWRQMMMFVPQGWEGKAIFKNVILLMLQITAFLAAYRCGKGTVCLPGRHDPITQTCHLLCG